MAQIKQRGEQFFYDDDGYQIELNQANFCGFQHRLGGFVLMDLVTVEDPRDELKFTHFRYSQDPEVIDQMLGLTQQVGTYILRDSPFEDIENTFYNMYGLKEDELDKLFGDGDE